MTETGAQRGTANTSLLGGRRLAGALRRRIARLTRLAGRAAGRDAPAPAPPPRYAPVTPEAPVVLRDIPRPRATDFPDSGPTPWLDRPDAEQAIADKEAAGLISAEEAELCRLWRRDGYLILRGFVDPETLDAAWASYEAAIAAGELTPQNDRGDDERDYPGRLLNPHFTLPLIRDQLEDARIVDLISTLLGADSLPFQTIIGHKTSQQLAHSDSIHMTTYPQGYLAATWLAFEDIDPDSGPLEYYPGSHRLPYVYSREAEISLEEGGESYVAYHQKYEPHIQNVIAEAGLEPHYFLAQKGDLLIWHANLLHGGSRRKRPLLSRKALVCHYFAKGCVCYHDYSASFSHLHSAEIAPD